MNFSIMLNSHIDNPDKIETNELEVSRKDTPMLLYYDGSTEHQNYHSIFIIVSPLGHFNLIGF